MWRLLRDKLKLIAKPKVMNQLEVPTNEKEIETIENEVEIFKNVKCQNNGQEEIIETNGDKSEVPNNENENKFISNGAEVLKNAERQINGLREIIEANSSVESLETLTKLEKKLEELREDADEWEKMILSGVLIPKEIHTTLADVHLPPSTIETLRMLTALSLVRPDAFTYGVLANNKILGVLLYGPPGAGKTHLAKALAKESGVTMLEISGAEIYQRWVGESEKAIRAIFTIARKLDPCIIFLDEADAVFRARTDDEKGYHRELINHFLKEWDGISSSKTKNGFVMVATNRPYDLDAAVLRRLPRRILVDLPTIEDREAILKIYLRDELLAPDIDMKTLAKTTQNYSGSDLKDLCVSAAMGSVYEEIKTANKDLASVEGIESLRLNLAKEKFPSRRTLHARHFDKALGEISPAIDYGSLAKIRNFQKTKLSRERHIELTPQASVSRFLQQTPV